MERRAAQHIYNFRAEDAAQDADVTAAANWFGVSLQMASATTAPTTTTASLRRDTEPERLGLETAADG